MVMIGTGDKNVSKLGQNQNDAMVKRLLHHTTTKQFALAVGELSIDSVNLATNAELTAPAKKEFQYPTSSSSNTTPKKVLNRK